jgi:nicotinamidase-related amidase
MDHAVAEDVGPEASAVDEAAQGAGMRETLQVGAGLTQASSDALDFADPELPSDKSVEVYSSGHDVPAGLGGPEAPHRELELVERLALDQREVHAARMFARERPTAVEIPITLEATAGAGCDLVDGDHARLGVAGQGEDLDASAFAPPGRVDRLPQGDVCRGEEVAGLDRREARRVTERIPRELRWRAVCDAADQAVVGAATNEGDPGTRPAERPRLGHRHESQTTLGKPVAPYRPRLGMPRGRRRDLRDVELEDRRDARRDGPTQRGKVAVVRRERLHPGSLGGDHVRARRDSTRATAPGNSRWAARPCSNYDDVVESERTALLIMDVQPEIVERLGDAGLTERLAEAAGAARAAGIRVIYVKVGFREGYPEVSPRSLTFSRIAELGGFVEGVSSSVHAAVAPQPGDVVVTKRRVSAFAGSDLDVVLRAGGIETLVLSGIATSGVVLSTVRQAADLDFSLVVLSDGCADADDEVHRVLCEKVFPRQADVLSVAAWISALA